MGVLFRKFHAYRCPAYIKIAGLCIVIAVFVIACAAMQAREEPPEVAAEPQPIPEPTPEPRPEPQPEEPSLKDSLDVEIATWRGFAGGAASITFDDGTWDQYALGAPVLEEYGVRGTFFIISHLMNRGVWNDSGTVRRLMSWDEAAELAEAGHEIGAHGATHADLSRSGADAEYELTESRRRIEEKLSDVEVVSMSWPYFRSTSEVRAIAEEVYIAARGGAAIPDQYRSLHETNPSSATPPDLYKINAIGVRPVDPPEDWIELAEALYAEGGWAVVTLHGIDDGSLGPPRIGWQPIRPIDLAAIIEGLQSRDLWIAPFGEVAAYIRHRERAEIELQALGEHEVSVAISGDERANRVGVPLTVRLSARDEVGAIPIELVGGLAADLPSGRDLVVEVTPNSEPLIIRAAGEVAAGR